jgi:murein DD-endopeptidase MepM/ murein hydrolase activator NlpD
VRYGTACGLALLFAAVATAAQACPSLERPERPRPRFLHPVIGEIVADFGWKTPALHQAGEVHTGIDYVAASGDPVFAAADGQVLSVEAESGGTYVTVRHANGFDTAYHPLGESAVRIGDCVSAGDVIGRVGAPGTYLHFELLLHRRFLKPNGGWLLDR